MNLLIKILIELLLVVVTLALFEYVVYAEVKKRGYKITCLQALRLQILALRITSEPVVILGLRMFLVFLVTGFPLGLISISTNFSILLVMVSLLGKVWSPFPVSTEILISSLFLIANIIVMHYFLSKYGSVYKLPVMFFIRDDVRQLLKKHQTLYEKTVYKTYKEIVVELAVSFMAYVLTVMSILESLIALPNNFPSVLSKISESIVVALLIGYVLFNKKYENVIELIEKIINFTEKIWSK